MGNLKLKYFLGMIILLLISFAKSATQESIGYLSVTKGGYITKYIVVALFETDERGRKTGKILSIDLIESEKEPTNIKDNILTEMHFENTPLEFVIKAISMATGLNIITSPILKESYQADIINTESRLGKEEIRANYNQNAGVLFKPINIYISKPLGVFELLNTILRESMLVAVPIDKNTYIITKAIEYKLDITGIRGENLDRLINLLKNIVSPAAEIVIDKKLEVLYIKDRIENLPKFKDIEEKLETFYTVETIEDKQETRVFFIKKKYSVEDVANIIRNKYGDKVEIYIDKDFNAIVISGNKKAIEDLLGVISQYVESTSKDELIVTKTFYIKFISVDTFKELIQPLLSEIGEVYVLGTNVSMTTTLEKELRKLERRINEYREKLLSTTDQATRRSIREELQFLLQRYEKLEEKLFSSATDNRTKVEISGYQSLSNNQDSTGPLFGKEKIATTKLPNAIIIRDYIRVIERIKETYKDIISEEPIQVKIEARIVEVDEEVLKELGLNWSALLSSARVPEAISGGIGINPPPGAPSLTPALLGRPQTGGVLTLVYQKGILNALRLKLSAFERVRKAKSLAKPAVITLNGEPAIIQSSIHFPVTRLSVTQTAVTVGATYESVPIILSVVPIVTPDKKVMLDITLTKKNIIDTVRYEVSEGFFQEFPVFSDSRVDTKIVVNDGDTVVIGGIISEAKNDINEGVPGLQRIPLLGWMFKEQRLSKGSKELLIFLTPTIINN